MLHIIPYSYRIICLLTFLRGCFQKINKPLGIIYTVFRILLVYLVRLLMSYIKLRSQLSNIISANSKYTQPQTKTCVYTLKVVGLQKASLQQHFFYLSGKQMPINHIKCCEEHQQRQKSFFNYVHTYLDNTVFGFVAGNLCW